jgi:hypothetical protein
MLPLVKMYDPRNLQLAKRAKAAGVEENALRIVYEAKRAGLQVSLAFGLVDHESEFRNVFGCDKGGLYCHLPVTKSRVDQMIRAVRAGHVSNGVGLTQLTSLSLLEAADRLEGGAARERNQLRVGFERLAALVRKYGTFHGLMAYNAGEAGAQRGLGHDYAVQVLERRDHWHDVLAPAPQAG